MKANRYRQSVVVTAAKRDKARNKKGEVPFYANISKKRGKKKPK